MARPLWQRTMGEEEFNLKLSKCSLKLSRVEKIKLSGELSFHMGRDKRLSQDTLEWSLREIVVFVDFATGAGF